MPRELTRAQCERLIARGGVGRIGMCTDTGPAIVPVNYVLDDGSIVFRTTAYSGLAKQVWGKQVAFEVDHLDTEHAWAWSVLALGRVVPIDDPEEIALLDRRGELHPWAAGERRLHMRIAPTRVSGRAIGALPEG